MSHGLRMAGRLRTALGIAGYRIIARTICANKEIRKRAVAANANEIKGLDNADSTPSQTTIEQLGEKIDHLTNIVNKLNSAATKEALSKVNSRPMPWKSDLASSEQRIFYLEWKLDAIEKRMRRNGVVISGLEIHETNVRESVRRFFKNLIQQSVSIEKATLLRRKDKPSLIIVTLNNYKDKCRIIAKSKILKGTGIYVSRQETSYDRDVRLQLKLIAKEETGKGKIVRMGYRTLTVDNVQYIWNHGVGLQKLPKKD